MGKIFKKVIVLVTILNFYSCSTRNDNLLLNNDLSYIELNEEVKKNIKLYKERYGDKAVIYLSFKNKIKSENNTFYIHRISNMSTIYDYYISYYTLVDDVPVVISSKEDSFVLPIKYSEKFISLMANYLTDNMLMNSITKSKEKNGEWELELSSNIIIDHSQVWKVKNGIVKKNWKKHPEKENVMIENNDCNLMDFYRVIPRGVDERKN